MADDNRPSWEKINWITSSRAPIIIEECQEFIKQFTAYVADNTRLYPADEELDWLHGNTNPQKVSQGLIIRKDLAGRLILVMERMAHG